MSYGNYILIESKEYWLKDEPLNTYWATIVNKPILIGLSSSPLDKGYYAKWELKQNKLFLLDFYGGELFFHNISYKFEDYFGKKSNLFLLNGLVEF